MFWFQNLLPGLGKPLPIAFNLEGGTDLLFDVVDRSKTHVHGHVVVLQLHVHSRTHDHLFFKT